MDAGWQQTKKALFSGLARCNPRSLWRNPVIFVTEIGAILTFLEGVFGAHVRPGFAFAVTGWLLLTVFFANFAEATAELRSAAQADALKSARVHCMANVEQPDGSIQEVPAQELRKGVVVRVRGGEMIPADGEIIHGLAQIDESSISGESEPVIRGAGTDQSTVTAGTKLLSDVLSVRVTSNPGESFLDQMIGLIEGIKRQRSKNEIALAILIAGLALILLVVCVAFRFSGTYFHVQVSVTMLVAFLICLIPTTIAGLLSAIGIAGMSRLMARNVLAMNGQSVEAAGDIDLILIDKTGTITLGRRHAVEFIPSPEVDLKEIAEAAYLCSILDETNEGRSIVDLALQHYPEWKERRVENIEFIPFRAETRSSGARIGATLYQKGAKSAVEHLVHHTTSETLDEMIDAIARKGGTPLVVAKNHAILGVISMKDQIKEGLSSLFARFHTMGIKTVMVTGDNNTTAAAIAREVGVGEFIAEASPEDKLRYLQQAQAQGLMVAMTGDGVNDAPALAQADLGVAMHAGTQPAKEAANMIDLDSHPTKLFEIIEIGKQMLMTRGALTTLSVANDVAKYFAVLPALLIPFFPAIAPLDIMHLKTPQSAVLSAVIFNAIVIVALVPLAYRGVRLLNKPTHVILRRNLLLYGLGGVVLPFIAIKAIDLLIGPLF